MSLNHGSRRGLVRIAVAVVLSAAALTSCKAIGVSLGSGSAPSSGSTEAAVVAGVVTAPDQGYEPIYHIIGAAHHTVDMTMYELVDTKAEQALADAAQRGVRVRVILDHHLEAKNNKAAFTFLSAHGVHVAWANTHYASTHQKTITIDDAESAILTGNLTSRYYSTTRDFAIIDKTHSDVTAIEETFDADFSHVYPFTPPDAADLVWSPTNAESSMITVIEHAQHTLQVENEEMSVSKIENALIDAVHRGVTVEVTMTRSSDWTDDFDKLVAGGVKVATYSSSASLYIHAKVIIADAGLSGQRALVGSENFSTTSLTRNRELGLTLTTPDVINSLHETLAHDYTGAEQWQS